MAVHRLKAIDGSLYFPYGGIPVDSVTHDPDPLEPSLLLKRYPAGDVDRCPWPMHSEYATEDQLKRRLASALYDERECNSAFDSHDTIELPDGTPFDFDYWCSLPSGDVPAGEF